MRKEQIAKIREKIENAISYAENQSIYQEELDKLIQNPNVKKYIELQAKIEQAKSDNEEFTYIFKPEDDTVENRVFEEYKDAYTLSKCQHDIWIYEGSYYLKGYTVIGCKECYQKETSENLPQTYDNKFKYNSYICLQCGEQVRVEDWQKFEQEHKVLKIQEYSVNIELYQRKFYMFLYQGYSEEEALRMVEEEFSENKSHMKKRRKHVTCNK